MGGAAAIIAATTAIARLGLDVNVTGWAPMAENMPSGTAQRPSDVLTIYGGTTVEVLNTDAEGRLVLADAHRAGQRGQARPARRRRDADRRAAGRARQPHLRGDGQRRRAARRDRGGAPSRPASRCGRCRCRRSCARRWSPTVADIANMGDRYGGMLTAGLFLKEFVRRGHPVGAPGHRGSVVQRRGSRTATRRRAAPGTPCAPWCGWPRTSPRATSPTPDRLLARAAPATAAHPLPRTPAAHRRKMITVP